MTRFGRVFQRPDYGLTAFVPLAAFGFAWWMGWSVFVSIGAFVAASIVTAILKPRRPGRWTE